MSTDLNTIPADSVFVHDPEAVASPEVFVTSFYGGAARGRCVQLTQVNNRGVVQLTERQAMALVAELNEWLAK